MKLALTGKSGSPRKNPIGGKFITVKHENKMKNGKKTKEALKFIRETSVHYPEMKKHSLLGHYSNSRACSK